MHEALTTAHRDLAVCRDRDSFMATRLKETHEALTTAHRELAAVCRERDSLLTEVQLVRSEINTAQTPASVLIENMIKEKYAERFAASVTYPEREVCVMDYIFERRTLRLEDVDDSTSLLMLASTTDELHKFVKELVERQLTILVDQLRECNLIVGASSKEITLLNCRSVARAVLAAVHPDNLRQRDNLYNKEFVDGCRQVCDSISKATRVVRKLQKTRAA